MKSKKSKSDKSLNKKGLMSAKSSNSELDFSKAVDSPNWSCNIEEITLKKE